jgi:Domain of Unknown Function (DUF1259)
MKTLILFSVLALTPLTQAALDTAKIETLTGLKGTLNEAERVFKVTAPRTDVKIGVDGWTMPPFMGLTSWAAFTPGVKAEVMVAGDLVLFEDEVNASMSAALVGGLSVTALHNHFFADEPKVYFMHIGGDGETAKLAAAVKAALDAVKAVRAAHPQPQRVFGKAFAPASNAITGAPLDAALSTKGESKDGMYKAVIGRAAKMPCGCEMGKEMGVNTWAAFAGTDDSAVVCGDFCVLEDELQSVLKSLRTEGVNIVAIHQHMTHEQPRYLFLHYWGKGPASKLAESLRKTLALQAK